MFEVVKYLAVYIILRTLLTDTSIKDIFPDEKKIISVSAPLPPVLMAHQGASGKIETQQDHIVATMIAEQD